MHLPGMPGTVAQAAVVQAVTGQMRPPAPVAHVGRLQSGGPLCCLVWCGGRERLSTF